MNTHSIRTQDKGFYSIRDAFNKPTDTPLVYTVERSQLSVVTMEDLAIKIGRYKYWASIKLDGKFIRVIKKGTFFRMVTSGHRDFYHNALASEMQHMADGQYNMELIHGDGLLKSRNKTGYLTTAYTKFSDRDPTAGDWRSDKAKGLRFVIHDFLPAAPTMATEYDMQQPYNERMSCLDLSYMQAKGIPVYGGDAAIKLLTIVPKVYIPTGCLDSLLPLLEQRLKYDTTVHEGLVFMYHEGTYALPKSKVNYKLKNIKEFVGEVVDVEMDKHGGNGTLIVDVTLGGKVMYCRVSSGINGDMRSADTQSLIGKKIEVEYESITDKGEFNLARIKRFDV